MFQFQQPLCDSISIRWFLYSVKMSSLSEYFFHLEFIFCQDYQHKN
uniref:Uncharacterized protein n=1 Tax=Arundo donax TaxID=35708 RepID=A0A0A9A338_ARUDO